MRRQAIVQAGAAGDEPAFLGIVRALDQPHELAHHVAVDPRRAEGVLGHHPARRENDEIQVRRAGHFRRRGQDGEYRRVRMVEADRPDGVEVRQIILVGRMVAVPGDDVERRMIDVGGPQVAGVFANELEGAVGVFIGRDRIAEIPRVGEDI